MEANDYIYPVVFAAVFILLLGFLFLIDIINKKRAITLFGIFTLFPAFIYFLDEFVAPGLWNKLILQNSLAFWVARITYSLAVLGLGFKAAWLTISGAMISGGIILFSAREIVVIKNESEKKEVKKKELIENLEKAKEKTKELLFIEENYYDVANLESCESGIVKLKSDDFTRIKLGNITWQIIQWDGDLLWQHSFQKPDGSIETEIDTIGHGQVLGTIEDFFIKPLEPGQNNFRVTFQRCGDDKCPCQ